MVRIKTITSKDVEFLSPFIYTEGGGKALIRKLEHWHTWKKVRGPDYDLEFVDFSDCPKDCFYNQHWGLADIMVHLPRAERVWENG